MMTIKQTPTCPKCRDPMVARKGKNGDFFGCSNFPKCKFTSKTRHIGYQHKQDFLDNVMPGHFNTTKK